jgi:hypothetical protein
MVALSPSMKILTLQFFGVALLALSACTTTRPDPRRAVRLSDFPALHQQGGQPAVDRALDERGLLLELKKGERLPVMMTATGDVVTTDQPQRVALRIQRDCTVFMTKRGDLQVSYDGRTFRPLKRVWRDSNLSIVLARDSQRGLHGKIGLQAWARP